MALLYEKSLHLWNPLLGVDKKHFEIYNMKLKCVFFGWTDQNEKTKSYTKNIK